MKARIMIAGSRILKYAGVIVLCLGSLSFGDNVHSQKKSAKKNPPLQPLPSGPTGPVPQVPLDSIAPVMPTVSYDKGQLTIVAPNSTLGEILKAVRKQTGADIDVPDAKERVVTHLGPGPAREIMAELLNGSRFNYVLLGSPSDSNVLTRVVLVAKAGSDNPGNAQPSRRPEIAQQQDTPPEASDADQPEETPDDNSAADQPTSPEPEQPVASPTDQQQPGVKTPQQLLQEMQQRQLQLQQQQQQQQQQPEQPPQ
jgi:hypothetical protein